jgi:hypothetical protein
MGLGRWPLFRPLTPARKPPMPRAGTGWHRPHCSPKRERAALEAAKALTFSDAAERYIAAHESAWRNPKHRHLWRATLAD